MNVVRKIADRLSLNSEQKERFIALVREATQARKIKRVKYVALTSQTRRPLSHWYHFALLTLLNENPELALATPEIACRLGITAQEARDAIEQVKKLELVDDSNPIGLKPRFDSLSVSSVDPDQTIREIHAEVLQKARAALALPNELRDFSAMTLLIEPSRLQEAKKVLRQFRRRFCARVEGSKGSAVYILSIQLFPCAKATSRPGREQIMIPTQGNEIGNG